MATHLVTEQTTLPLRPTSVSTIMRFLDNCSWMRQTFSVPLTMKYPPGSMGHSFRRAISAGLFPCSTQLELRSMMGILVQTSTGITFVVVTYSGVIICTGCTRSAWISDRWEKHAINIFTWNLSDKTFFSLLKKWTTEVQKFLVEVSSTFLLAGCSWQYAGCRACILCPRW